MAVQLYRLHTARKLWNASSGYVKIYEDQQEFLNALFEAQLESEAEAYSSTRERDRWWHFQRWMRKHRKGWQERWHATRVIKAQRLGEDGEWHDIEWRLEPPVLRVTRW